MTATAWQSEDGRVALYCGDCLAVLPTLPDASVDAVVTDPPYGHNNNGDLIARREEAYGAARALLPWMTFRLMVQHGDIFVEEMRDNRDNKEKSA